jgi:hypothetical protein
MAFDDQDPLQILKTKRQIHQIWLQHHYGLKLPQADWGREITKMLQDWRSRPDVAAAISRFQREMHEVLKEVCIPYGVVPQLEKSLEGVDVDFYVEMPVPGSAKMVASNTELLQALPAATAAVMGSDVLSLLSSYREEAASKFVFEADGMHHFRGDELDGATEFRNSIVPLIINGQILGISEPDWNKTMNQKNGRDIMKQQLKKFMGFPDPVVVAPKAKK